MNDKNNNLTDTVNVMFHASSLTDKTVSYAKVQRNTALSGNIATEILKNNKVFDRETLLYVAGLYRNAVLSLLESGKAVEVLELGTLYLKPKKGMNLQSPTLEDVPEMTLAFTPSELAVSSVKNVSAGAEVSNRTEPHIERLYNVSERVEGNLLSEGGTVRIKGQKLKVAGESDDTGLFFAPCDSDGSYNNDMSDWLQVKPNELVDNSASSILFNLPHSVSSGSYRLILRTAYGSGSRLNKTVRCGVYDAVVTVA